MNARTKSKSPTGWWLAAVLERQSDPKCAPYWNNYRLVKADDWRTAFRRATEMGQRETDSSKRAFSHPLEFIGITDLVPIYDEFEDGAELLWQELWPDDDSPNESPLQIYTEDEMAEKYEGRDDENQK